MVIRHMPPYSVVLHLTGEFLLQVLEVFVAVLVLADQRSGFGITCTLLAPPIPWRVVRIRAYRCSKRAGDSISLSAIHGEGAGVRTYRHLVGIFLRLLAVRGQLL
jgi:hypothetical protein